jgi:hypothetical protein
MAAGFTMLGIGLFFTTRNGEEHRVPSFKHIWLHGMAAAFGGDFLVVLALTLVLVGNTIPTGMGFLVGLLFGLGSMLAQSIIAFLAYRGIRTFVTDMETIRMSGIYSLVILGVFLVILGILTMLNVVPGG